MANRVLTTFLVAAIVSSVATTGAFAQGTVPPSSETGIASGSENFDGTVSGWTLGDSGTVKWGIDGTPATVGSGGQSSAQSGTKSLNFNNGTNYDAGTGVAAKGTATSPTINLSGMTSPTLKFYCNFETEAETNYDQRILKIESADGATTHGTWQFLPPSPASGTAVGTAVTCGTSGTWHQHTINLSAEWGQIRLKFTFDSKDSFLNDYAGWFIDTMTVQGTGGGAPGAGLLGSKGGEGREGLDPVCYVATASCGRDSDEVQTLVRFREAHLRTSSAGNVFWKAYEAKGGLVADQVAASDNARGATRLALGMATGQGASIVMILALLALGVAFARRLSTR